MADENFRTENGLLLSDSTMVEFEDGCGDAMTIVPGHHEIGAEVPCPNCDGEHRIARAESDPSSAANHALAQNGRAPR